MIEKIPSILTSIDKVQPRVILQAEQFPFWEIGVFFFYRWPYQK